MNPHYQPFPPHRSPPPPPPPEALQDEAPVGAQPRCYFCGKAIAEEEVRKTEYHVGHGHNILVMICPACLKMKERGEGRFKPRYAAILVPILMFVAFGLFVLFMVKGTPFISSGKVQTDKSATDGGLTLEVNSIEKGLTSFRIHMTARNGTQDQLTLPLFGYFKAVDNLGNQYDADPFSSTFPRNVAPGATISGYADMKSSLHKDAASLRVGFTTVFGSFAVKSINVEQVPVNNR